MNEFKESKFYKLLQDFFINNDKETFIQFLAEFYNRTEGIIDKNGTQDEIIKELREMYIKFNEEGINENIVRDKVNYFIENSGKIKDILAKLVINTNKIEDNAKRINEVAQTGTTMEAVQNKVSEMAQNGSITFNTVSPEMTTFIDKIGASNLYSNAGYIDNKRVNENGQLVDWNYCFTLNIFKVKPNTTYSFSINNGKNSFSIKYLVQKEYELLDDFRKTGYNEDVTSITTNENTQYLGISIEKNILSSNGGNYNTIDDFLNDFVIQESETNEEIKGYELNNISIPYIDLKIEKLKEINKIKGQIATLSGSILYSEPVYQYSNGYSSWIVSNGGYNMVDGEIYSYNANGDVINKIQVSNLDAWDTINSRGEFSRCTKEIDLSVADLWRSEDHDSNTALAFGLWINLNNIEKGNVGDGENATYKTNNDLFIKTYGNVRPTQNAMAYGNYTDGLGQCFYISVLKTNLETQDIAGVKKYLRRNNVKIKVKLNDNISIINVDPICVVENGVISSSNGLNIKASKCGIKKSNLHGKIGMSLGDSLSALGKWQELVSNDLGIKSWVNLAVGGQRVSKFAENVTSENLKDVDFVTVMGYFNSYDCPDGNSGDLPSNGDTDSIWSNYKYIINKLKTLKPSVDIIIMSAHKPAPPNNTDSRAEVVKQIAKYYSLPFIDIHNEGGFNEYTYSIYMYEDKIHCTDLGYEKEAKLISGELRRIFG